MEEQVVNKPRPGEKQQAKTLSDVLVERMIAWGIDTIFGIPGDGVNGFVEALRRHQDSLKFIHVRNEAVGALAAVSYAKFTGRIGVCYATTGPGAIHLLQGMLDAQMDRVPVLAITGLTHHDLIGSEIQQDTDTNQVFEPFTAFNQRIMGPAHVETVVDKACRVALSKRMPVHVAIPADFQSTPAEAAKPSPENVPGHTRPGYTPPVLLPEHELIRQAATLLNSRKKIAILVGTGARGASKELEALAEKLGAPIAKAMLGKDVIPDDSPYTTGGTGHTATWPTQQAFAQCDALLIIGSTMPFLKWYPKPGQAACIQIDDKPERIGMRYPVDIGLAGDAKAILQQLLPLLDHHEDRSFLQQAQQQMKEWWKLMEAQGSRQDRPMKPQVVAWQLSQYLKDDAILCGDAGTVAYWINRHVKLRQGQRFSLSGTSCTMMAGIAYAIGAQVAYPQRQVVAFMGDGSLTMAMGDLLTLVQYKLPVKIILLKNNTLALEKWEQMMFLGNPEYGNDLAPADFQQVAKGCGIPAVRIDDPAACAGQLKAALSAEGPLLVECVVDPHEPTLEAPIPEEHADKFLAALEKTTKDKAPMAEETKESIAQQQALAPDSVQQGEKKLSDGLSDDPEK